MKSRRAIKQSKNQRTSHYRINYGLYAYLGALIAACFVLYAHTTSYKYTELDDTIFIRDMEPYTRSDSYLHSFERGLFSDTSDIYYRPMVLNSFMWDRHREGNTSFILHNPDATDDDISQYHWTNILLHIASTALLFLLLRRLLNNDTISFVLAMIFAVHPVLAQAVIWIPGRNDTLLAVFTFGFLLCVLEYIRTQTVVYLILQPLLLLGALFTKETGIIAAPIAFVLVVVTERVSPKNRHLWFAASTWVIALMLWIYFRSVATIDSQSVTVDVLMMSLVERMPAPLQYLGKIILPFGLSVFPWQEDTTLWYGVAAAAILVLGIALAPRRNWRTIITGCVWYFAFLIPALTVPKSINREAFEYRLYLPIVGVLILLGQTVVFQHTNTKRILYIGLAVCFLLGVYNYLRSDVFNGKFAFWEEAVATTPSSAYAKMMLGSRYYRDKVNPRKEKGMNLLLEAYKLDSTQKYLNYYLGSAMMDRGEWLKMDEYLAKEKAQDQPVRVEIYSNRARGYVERKMFEQAESFLLKWIDIAPYDQVPNVNLLLLYTNDLPNPKKARAHAEQMIAKRIPVPQQLLHAVGLL